MEIKIAKLDDLKLIDNLCQEVKKDYHLWNADYPNYSDFVYIYNNGLILICKKNEEIIGSLSIEYGMEDFEEFKDCISFSKFMTKKDCRKKGIGRALFEMGEQIAREKGYRKIVFLVHKDNAYTLGLYERWGYENKGRYDTPWVDNIDEYYFLFEKDITL